MPIARPESRHSARLFIRILLIATAYFLAGRLALLLAIPPGYATPIWPAAGIALASVLLCGYRVWPGIWLGSFLVNVGTAFDGSTTARVLESFALPAMIASGATIEALVGGVLIARFRVDPKSLKRERDLFAFIALGGPLACLIGASVGATALWLFGAIDTPARVVSFTTWWIGDTIGVVVAAPVFVAFTGFEHRVPRRTRVALAATMALLFAAGVVLFVKGSGWERGRIRLEFERRAHLLSSDLERGIESYAAVVPSVRALFETTRHVDKDEFRRFVTPLLARHPGIQALSYAPRISAAERAGFEEWGRRGSESCFEIVEQNDSRALVRARDKDEYFPVLYLEPPGGNEAALGFDLSSNPARADALVRSRDEDKLIATGRIRLVQGNGDDWGVLLVQPIFARGAHIDTEEERRENLVGYVSAVLRIPAMIAALSEPHEDGDFDFTLTDDSAPPEERLLHSFTPEATAVARAASIRETALPTGSAATAAQMEMDRSVTIAVADRSWTARYALSGATLLRQRSWTSWGILASSLLFFGLFSSFLLVITGRTAAIEEEVKAKTAQIRASREELRKIIDHAQDAFIAMNSAGMITDWNPQAVQTFGWSRDEALGRRAKDLIVPSEQRDAHEQEFRRFLATGEPSFANRRVEVEALHRDGRKFPAEVTISPVESASGWRFNAFLRDVTELKRNTERLRLVEASPNAMLMLDEGRRIVLVNHRAETLFGFTRRVLLGTRLEDLLPERFRGTNVRSAADDKEFLAALARRSVVDGSDVFALRGDGVEVPIEIELNHVDSPEGAFTLASIVDVTDRKRAQERARTIAALSQAVGDAGDAEAAVKAVLDLVGMKSGFVLGEAWAPAASQERLVLHPAWFSRGDEFQSFRFDAFASDGAAVGEAVATRVWKSRTPEWIADLSQDPDFPKRPDGSAGRLASALYFPVVAGQEVVLVLAFFFAEPRLVDKELIDFVGGVTAQAGVLLLRKQAEAATRHSLEEKEFLLKEIHHRVKNNLQIVSSLLYLQSGNVHDHEAVGAIKNSEMRVRAMSMIHELLYQSETLAEVEFGRYARRLVTHLFESYGVDPARVRPVLAITGASLPIDVAIPCGLILVELVSNGLKHAFPDRASGEIHIACSRTEHGACRFEISDNGVGFPAGKRIEDFASLGLRVVRSLSQQLGATLVHESAPGCTKFTLTFVPQPTQAHAPRVKQRSTS